VACSGTAQYAYVANSADNTVSQYTVGAGGDLTPMSPPTVTTGTAPQSVIVDATGSFAYVANLKDNTVSQVHHRRSGALAPNTPATVATGSGPSAVTLHHPPVRLCGRRHGQHISQYTIAPGAR